MGIKKTGLWISLLLSISLTATARGEMLNLSITTSDTLTKKEAQDTVTFKEVEIEQIAVRGVRRGNYIGGHQLMKTEVVGKLGLQKMACCNVAESFENSASITVSNSDGVTGTKQIRMLGLNGIYTSLLQDGRVVSRGLSSPYELTYMPGPWLSGVHISKGIATVSAGSEAMTGHINMQTKSPELEEPLFINVYVDQELRSEVNLTSSLQLNENLSTAIFGHFSIEPLKRDHNGDGFADMPVGGLLTLSNNWQYIAPRSGVQIRGGVKYVADKRMGGQMLFDHSIERELQQNYYGSNIENEQVNAFFKIAKPTDDYGSNLAFTADYNYFRQKAFYGIKDYSGRQNSLFADLKYYWNMSDNHTLLFGASTTMDFIGEYLSDRYINPISSQPYPSSVMSRDWDLGRNDKMGGVFAEYTYTLGSKLTLIGGVRLDYANFYGFYATPRAHLKWSITPRTTVRASGGMGYRAASLLSDNIGILATGRMIDIAEGLDRMERGATFGGSFTQTFRLAADDNASVSVDVFHTSFSNQVIADMEWDASKVYFYNLRGGSTATAYQIDFNWQPLPRFDVLVTFRYNDTRIKLQNSMSEEFIERERPLVDKFKGLINLQYATKFRKWVFDFTAQINGQSRLPITTVEQSGMAYSPVYPMLYAQVTKNFKRWNIYLGCENLLDYRQTNPVLNAESPFSTDFNAAVIWGPLMGRRVYLGVRITL